MCRFPYNFRYRNNGMATNIINYKGIFRSIGIEKLRMAILSHLWLLYIAEMLKYIWHLSSENH